jgi:hypothetical protein
MEPREGDLQRTNCKSKSFTAKMLFVIYVMLCHSY